MKPTFMVTLAAHAKTAAAYGIALLFFVMCNASQAGAPSGNASKDAPGNAQMNKPAAPLRILAKLKNPQAVNNQAFSTSLGDLGLVRKKSIGLVPGLHFIEPDPDSVRKHDAQSLKGAIKELVATGLFEYVESDQLVSVQQLPDDSRFTDGTLWGLRNNGQNGGRSGIDVNAVPAWDITTGTNDIVVGVIDTGVRYTHQDLSANMWINQDEIPDNGIDDDNNGYIDDRFGINAINGSGDPMDDNGHGSHCSGTIAATAFGGGGHVGVAYNVRIMALKFLAAGGWGSNSDAITCIDYAVANGAHITNNSWGGGGASQALLDSIRAANDAGVLFVAAAGNDSSNNDSVDSYPANYDVENVIAVAAIDRVGSLARFSNYGVTNVDLGAPGVDIYSTVSNSDTSYDTYDGTSMATPHVAGVAALLKSRDPSVTIAELRSRLLLGTTPLSSLQGRVATGGMVNALNSLNLNEDGDLELRVEVDGLLEAGKENTVRIVVTDMRPVTGATVTGFFGSQLETSFLDDGNFPDQTANDAVYSARIEVPLPAGPIDFTANASAPGKNPATQVFEMTSVSVPTNDDFADRIVLAGGTTTTTGSNIYSTSESGEPRNPFGAGGKSVWWSWTAQSSGAATITTSGSSFDTTLAVYAGEELATLSLVASNDDTDGLQSSVTFSAIEGQVYAIQIDGYFGEEGAIVLNYPDPGFASSVPQIVRQPQGRSILINTPLKLSVSAAGSPPLQFQWFIGTRAIEGANSPVYEKTAALSDQGTYRVEVSNDFGTVASQPVFVSVNLTGTSPSNDNFTNATPLDGSSGTMTGTNVLSTAELGEPNHTSTAPPVESVWYVWQAPSSGVLTVNTFGSDFDTVLAAYTGNAVGALTRIASNDDTNGRQSMLSFSVSAGVSYQIAVDGFGSEEGDVVLRYDFVPSNSSAPSNDMFANRINISGTGAMMAGSNMLATAEPGEPNHAEASAPIESVWWSWTAPSHGQASFSTAGSNFDTTIAVYTGTDIASLTLVAFNDDSSQGISTSALSFEVTPGQTYVISVDGYAGSKGSISLSNGFTSSEGREPNDLFASRIAINGRNAVVTGSNRRAHAESGEPNHAGYSEPIQSVWWSWTAPVNGMATFNTNGSNFDTAVAVYTGTQVNNLTLVGADDDSGGPSGTSLLTVEVVAGTTYAIAVDGYGNATGSISLQIEFDPVVVIPPSEDADLAALALSDGALSPAFSSSTISYSVPLPYGVNQLVITPTASHDKAVIQVNDTVVSSGQPTSPVPIMVGSNTVTILVTAESGATKTYTLTVARATPSMSTDLSDILVSRGSLAPDFSSAVTKYKVAVANPAESVRVTAIAAHPGAAIKINGVSVESGVPSQPLSLAVGDNLVRILVTAESGRLKTYEITFTRAKSSNAKLASLSVKDAKLVGDFKPRKSSYRATASANKRECWFAFAPADPNATAKINGKKWKKDKKQYRILLKKPKTVVRIVVTAQNGAKKIYKITVNKKKKRK